MKRLALSYRRCLQFAACALSLSAPVLFAVRADASPLDKNACAKLAQEIQNLKMLDVDKMMEKGPAWAADHLSTGDLALVRQYIHLDEQMKFRCAAPGSLVHLKHLEDEDEDNGAKPAEDASASKARSEGVKPKPKAAKAAEKAKRPAQTSLAGSR